MLRLRVAPGSIAAVVLGVLGLLTVACERETPGLVRLIPAPDAPGTSALPRARIDDESRFVVAGHPEVVIRSREEMILPSDGDLRVPAEVPDTLAGRDVRLDAHLALVTVGAEKPLDPQKWRSFTITAEPVVRWHRDPAASPGLLFPLAPGLGGTPAVLSVIARALPDSPIERMDIPPVRIPAGARLRFGYGVEQPGWTRGWPPVIFRAVAVGDPPLPLFERRLDPSADARDRRWFDASVDLAPVAGRRVGLRFEIEAVGDAPGTTVDRSFAVIANPTVVSPASLAEPSRPNIVLISLDTLRARSVSSYGYFHGTTPALDRRLAAAGALVRTVVSPFPYTTPSHMTMFTGLEPCAHQVWHLDDRLAPNISTLPELLRAEGYATAAFTENALLFHESGFERGFDLYRENRSAESASPGFAAETFAAARAWLTSHTGGPFFLFIHTYQVHSPHTPPRGYGEFFADGGRNRLLAAYEREVRYTDDVLADFLDALETHPAGAHTMVVVTSDHGEAFGEHFWGHGYDLHDEVLLVPLVVRAPGLVRPGQVIEQQVGLVDLAPTLLELVGLAPIPAMRGQSFAGLLTGSGTAFEERPVLSAALNDRRSIRTPLFKYIRMRDGERLYDLTSDPAERKDRAPANDVWLAAARDAMDRVDAACAQWRRDHRAQDAAVAPVPPVRAEPKWLFREEEVERKLRSLGYVQ